MESCTNYSSWQAQGRSMHDNSERRDRFFLTFCLWFSRAMSMNFCSPVYPSLLSSSHTYFLYFFLFTFFIFLGIRLPHMIVRVHICVPFSFRFSSPVPFSRVGYSQPKLKYGLTGTVKQSLRNVLIENLQLRDFNFLFTRSAFFLFILFVTEVET